MKQDDDFLILMKVTGELDHGGADVLDPDSAGFLILKEFVDSVNNPALAKLEFESNTDDERSIFDDVQWMDGRSLLRRITLSLAGRLPSEAETNTVSEKGTDSLPVILDGVMKEDAFYDRLREGFNDIFLTVGFDGNAETSLSYEHFSETRG
jgi:hypothetical protein